MVARQAGVGSLPSRWGSGRQTGGSEDSGWTLVRRHQCCPCISGEKPLLLGAGQGFWGQLVCEKHHLCFWTMRLLPGLSPSHLPPHPPTVAQGCKVCVMGVGGSEQSSSFPGLCSSLTRRKFSEAGNAEVPRTPNRHSRVWVHGMLMGFKGWLKGPLFK